jgi:hypothetical protein
MKAYGNCTRGGSWSGAHVPLPTAPVVHQRPHITQLEHAADRAPTIPLTGGPAATPVGLRDVVDLHHTGLCPTDIARRTGIDVKTVRARLKAAGIKAHDGRRKADS